jgi:hypothetical protein
MLCKTLTIWIAFLSASSSLMSYSVFHLGNSHTWDLKPNYGLGQIFKAGGEVLDNDWQIVCGQSLNYIVANPSSACVYPVNYEGYVDALTNRTWDVVTIQPFPGATGGEELTALSDVIDLASLSASSGQTRFLVYCTWPIIPDDVELVSFDYATAWELSYTASSDATLANQEFFIYAMKSICDLYPDLSIEAIPAGSVLAAFHSEAIAGRVTGFAGAGELYRDNYHMNNVGHYIVALTAYAVITGNKAIDLGDTTISGFAYTDSEVDHELTSELKLKIAEIVDDVIAEKPFNSPLPKLNLADAGDSKKAVQFKTYTGFEYTLEFSENMKDWITIFNDLTGDSSTYNDESETDLGFWRLSRD